MGKIQVLDTMLTNMIAAGEVVERISSVVKELTENSIDAGATKIKIALTDAGLSEIRVIDNGSGMDARDARMCVLPHATSKLHAREDLFSIRTLGFRGEALASIASISNFKIITSTDGYHGFMITWKGGILLSEATIAHPKGTEIIVKNLFYNTPVRLQSLQSQNIELGYVIDYVSKMALARPNVAFELSNNNKILVNTFGSNDVLEAIYSIYGAKVAKSMVSIFDDNGLYKIEGFISKIQETRSTKNNIVLAINGRVIRNYSIVNAIIAGYGNKLMLGRYPIALINIKVDASMVDVNVHPSKLEVRFSNEDKLKEMITRAIENTLSFTDLTVNIEDEKQLNREQGFFSKYDEPLLEEVENPNSIANTLDNLAALEQKAQEGKNKVIEENVRTSPFEEDNVHVESDETESIEDETSIDDESIIDEEEFNSPFVEDNKKKIDEDESFDIEDEIDESEDKDEIDESEDKDVENLNDTISDDTSSNDTTSNDVSSDDTSSNDDVPFAYDTLFDYDDKEVTDLLQKDHALNAGNYPTMEEENLVLNESISQYNEIIPENVPESVDFDAKEAEIGLSEKINSEKVKYEQLSLEELDKELKQENNNTNSDQNNGTAQNLPQLHYIGQLFGTYILANDDSTFYLIDQHAAMERINYEKIKKELINSHTLTYDLLIPFNVEFSPQECYIINEHKDEIEALGIELEEFGTNSFVVRTIPTWIFRGREKEFVEEIISKIIHSTQEKEYNKAFFLDALAKSLACKKSIKGNEFHSELEINFLLDELSHTLNPYTCPHGRPVIIKLNKDEIEKWFKRIV